MEWEFWYFPPPYCSTKTKLQIYCTVHVYTVHDSTKSSIGLYNYVRCIQSIYIFCHFLTCTGFEVFNNNNKTFFGIFLLALALMFAGRVASVFTSVSINSIVNTDPELRQTAKILGKPGFHARFNTLTPAQMKSKVA